ncbi:MAG: HD domain-containing protein [Acidobacteriota bacterium]|nr:HD domain-containing protein [Acidobacteriota bacterium]
MRSLLGYLYRLKLRQLLFAILLFSGIIPLAISSFLLIRQNKDILRTQEKSYLARSSEFLSQEVDGFLVETRRRLEQLGDSVLAVPGESVESRLRQEWIEQRAHRFLEANPGFLALRLLDPKGVGPQYASTPLTSSVLSSLEEVFRRSVESQQVAYGFVGREELGSVSVVVAVPAGVGEGEAIIVQGLLEATPMESFFLREAVGDVAVFLIDDAANILWSEGSNEDLDQALAQSDIARESSVLPGTQTAEYELTVAGKAQEMLARVSPVPAAGWGVLVQKPAARAFSAVRQMIFKTALSTAVLIGLALLGAVMVAERFSRPIQDLTQSSHEIAQGNFGQRVEVTGPGAEIGQLATDFNRMSTHVEASVRQLKDAAQDNRELFIGSMRAFVAAIDAKDPYTRGHSERVAAHSRTIAKRLGLNPEEQHKIWVGALLHDVGKIGVDDRVLKKGGVLSDAEFEQMKLHPVIGAQIMSRIERLKAMIPAIRWHHEAWGGTGYPDGLSGEQIPLMARIVAVADTFDAITTNRPYQRAFEPAFAVQRVKELAGSRFDAKVVTAFLQAFEAGEVQLRRQTSTAESNRQTAVST